MLWLVSAGSSQSQYDAFLLVSFGGPEGTEEVLPFLRNVLRGRRVPDSRLEQVAQHYYLFGGESPINSANRRLLQALKADLAKHAIDLPLYWGNRNWHPLLEDTLAHMRDDGVRRALALATSAYASYSGCRQYLDNIAAARAKVGEGAPIVDKLRLFYNHPGFVEPMAESLRNARNDAGFDAPVLFSAHSIPADMAAHCDYQHQLDQTARLVAARAGQPAPRWSLVYQSRSGPPAQPWIGPGLTEALDSLPSDTKSVVVSPIGFVSEHMEVVYDIDTEASAAAAARGVRLVRAATADTHPRFVSMVTELLEERVFPGAPRLALGSDGPRGDICRSECCPRSGAAPRDSAGAVL